MLPVFTVFAGVSIDGFLARPDGSLDWLNDANKVVPQGEDCGHAEFMASIDAVVMGRKTFETALGFDQWPYSGKSVYVVSRTMTAMPPTAPGGVVLLRGTPTELAGTLAKSGHRRVYVEGGQTVQAFMAEGLIHEITLTHVPILIGTGRPLFGSLPQDVHLRHVATKSYPFGFVQSHYTTSRKPPA